MTAYTFPTGLPGNYAVGDTITFNYTGAVQTFSAANIKTMKIELWGAVGGSGGDTPGNGGYTYGTYNTTNGTTLNVYCGGAGFGGGSNAANGYAAPAAAFNGGGLGGLELTQHTELTGVLTAVEQRM